MIGVVIIECSDSVNPLVNVDRFAMRRRKPREACVRLHEPHECVRAGADDLEALRNVARPFGVVVLREDLAG